LTIELNTLRIVSGTGDGMPSMKQAVNGIAEFVEKIRSDAYREGYRAALTDMSDYARTRLNHQAATEETPTPRQRRPRKPREVGADMLEQAKLALADSPDGADPAQIADIIGTPHVRDVRAALGVLVASGKAVRHAGGKYAPLSQ
jgi:hypothetical protein